MQQEEWAEQVLDLVRRADADVEAEVVIDSQDLALTRFANSFIHQNVAETSTSVRLRLHTGGRTAAGSSSRTDADGLAALVDRTLSAARLSPPDPRWAGLAPRTANPAGGEVDEATAHAEPAARADRVRAFVAAAGGLETAGYCQTMHWSSTVANSAGQLVTGATAEAAFDGIVRNAGADGVARLVRPTLAELDGGVLGARATAKAQAGTNPVELPPGRYEVVMEPTAVVDLLQVMAAFGFNGKAVEERRSFVELGTAQMDRSVTLVDDPLGSGGAGLMFDVEGTVRGRLTLVDAGLMAAVTHDRRTAAQAGTQSTGHALAGGAAWGALPMNLHLLPAASNGGVSEVDGPAADSSVAALVAKVGRGLLVTDNWYTRVLDPRTLVVTGLTRNGVWLIEDGQLVRPVRNLRFTQSYPQALAPGAVLGVGTSSVPLPSGWGVMTYRAPALHLASWNYTGNSSG